MNSQPSLTAARTRLARLQRVRTAQVLFFLSLPTTFFFVTVASPQNGLPISINHHDKCSYPIGTMRCNLVAVPLQ
jgi:hypothetical protein